MLVKGILSQKYDILRKGIHKSMGRADFDSAEPTTTRMDLYQNHCDMFLSLREVTCR